MRRSGAAIFGRVTKLPQSGGPTRPARTVSRGSAGSLGVDAASRCLDCSRMARDSLAHTPGGWSHVSQGGSHAPSSLSHVRSRGGGGGRIPPASARVTFANAPLVRARSTAETSLCMEVADSRSGHGAGGDLGDCLLNGPLHAHRPHFTAQETGLREATELVPSHHGCHWAELSLRPGSALRPALCISSPFSDLSH